MSALDEDEVTARMPRVGEEDLTTPTPLFREEALEHHAGQRQEGQLLRLSPGWTRWSFWLLAAVVAAAIVYAALGTIHEYAAGPAVVRVEDCADLTATFASGRVSTSPLASCCCRSSATTRRCRWWRYCRDATAPRCTPACRCGSSSRAIAISTRSWSSSRSPTTWSARPRSVATSDPTPPTR